MPQFLLQEPSLSLSTYNNVQHLFYVKAMLAEPESSGHSWLSLVPSPRPLFEIASPMGSLNIVRMVVSVCRTHAPGLDVVRNNLPAISKRFAANPTFHLLLNNLPGQQSSHFGR